MKLFEIYLRKNFFYLFIFLTISVNFVITSRINSEHKNLFSFKQMSKNKKFHQNINQNKHLIHRFKKESDSSFLETNIKSQVDMSIYFNIFEFYFNFLGCNEFEEEKSEFLSKIKNILGRII